MKPIDRTKLRTVSAKRRHSKVNTGDFAKPIPAGASFKAFFDSLPRILKAADLQDLAEITARAHKVVRYAATRQEIDAVRLGNVEER